MEVAGRLPLPAPQLQGLWPIPPTPELRSCWAQPPSISCVTEEGTQPQRGPGWLTCCRRQQLRPEYP